MMETYDLKFPNRFFTKNISYIFLTSSLALNTKN